MLFNKIRQSWIKNYLQKLMNKKLNFKKAFITGISGSGGSYLADYINENIKDCEVHGISRWHSRSSLFSNVQKGRKIHEGDLNDISSIINILKKVKPDVIFHLASHANVRLCFITPNAVVNNNINSTLNLLEALRILNQKPVIQICSTSEVYGQVNKNEVPINENNQLRPSSPYAVSKLAQDMLGYTYFKNYNFKIIRTRMFSYLNPRREDLFATSFAKQVALIEKGKQKYLMHGNLKSIRTLIDVRDAMEAYWFAVKFGKVGQVYNIGGEYTLSVGEFLEELKNISSVKIISKLDKKLLRPTDVTRQIPDCTKFKKDTKWKPKYSIRDSIENLLNYWRDRV